MKRQRLKIMSSCLVGLSLIFVAGCGADGDSPSAGTSEGSSGGTAAPGEIPAAELDQALHDSLPAEIKDAGKLLNGSLSPHPPYLFADESGELVGINADFATALGQVLGVEIEAVRASEFAVILPGIDSGRYDYSMGPFGDRRSRQENYDILDWSRDPVVFAVEADNPKGINSLAEVCGQRIGVVAGGGSEAVLKGKGTDDCVSAGKPAPETLVYANDTTAILAVSAGRADAVFSTQSSLSYFVKKSNVPLTLTERDSVSGNGFGEIYLGAALPKDSELTPILQEALQTLVDEGIYTEILKKWEVDFIAVNKIEVNRATTP